MDEKEYCPSEKFGTGGGEVRVQRDFKEKKDWNTKYNTNYSVCWRMKKNEIESYK